MSDDTQPRKQTIYRNARDHLRLAECEGHVPHGINDAIELNGRKYEVFGFSREFHNYIYLVVEIDTK